MKGLDVVKLEESLGLRQQANGRWQVNAKLTDAGVRTGILRADSRDEALLMAAFAAGFFYGRQQA